METFLKLIRVGGNGRLLLVTADNSDTPERIGDFFLNNNISYDKVSIEGISSLWDDKIFDTVILADVLSLAIGKAIDESKTLRLLAKHLDEAGRIYVLERNRIWETGEEKKSGFVRQELLRAADNAGLHTFFYYPYPDIYDMSYVFSDKRQSRGEVMEAATAEGIFPSLAPIFLACIKKDDTPEHLIYKKYNIKRKNRFQTSTGIYETPGGTRFVTKEALNEAALDTLTRIDTNYKKLVSFYKGYTLQLAECVPIEKSNALRIEYIQGVTLEMLLERTLAKDDYETFSNLLRRMSDIMTSPARIMTEDETARMPFSSNESFRTFFGSLSPEEEMVLKKEMSLPITNIDKLFSGIYIKERTWIMADYEWLYDFAVPFTYVIYRQLWKFFEKKPRYDRLYKEMLERFEITAQMESIYRRMSENFDMAISRESIPLRKPPEKREEPRAKKGFFKW